MFVFNYHFVSISILTNLVHLFYMLYIENRLFLFISNVVSH